MPEWQTLFSALREHDINVSDRDMPRPVGGGDISAAWRVKTDDNSVFLKTGPASSYDMFPPRPRASGNSPKPMQCACLKCGVAFGRLPIVCWHLNGSTSICRVLTPKGC